MSDALVVLLVYPPGVLLGVAVFHAWQSFQAWRYWRRVSHSWTDEAARKTLNYQLGCDQSRWSSLAG